MSIDAAQRKEALESRANNPVPLVAVEQSTSAGSWTEHICITRMGDGLFRLDIRGYAYLCDVEDDWVDEYGNVELREEVDGKSVALIEDGQVVSNELVDNREGHHVMFRCIDDEPVVEWFEQEGLMDFFDEVRREWMAMARYISDGVYVIGGIESLAL